MKCALVATALGVLLMTIPSYSNHVAMNEHIDGAWVRNCNERTMSLLLLDATSLLKGRSVVPFNGKEEESFLWMEEEVPLRWDSATRKTTGKGKKPTKKRRPTRRPTQAPSGAPSQAPSETPTQAPSEAPTKTSSASPTQSDVPTKHPKSGCL